jgi:hypothetical protein
MYVHIYTYIYIYIYTYIGLKYALKSIEDIIYEMSLLDDSLPMISASSNKKQRTEGSDDVSMAGIT